MTVHTKEPWPAPRGACLDIPYRGFIHAEGYCGTEANARRIVDCVNANAGISDPAAFVAAAMDVFGVAERLLQLAIDGELGHDLVAQLYPEHKKLNGQPAFNFAKRAQREMNEARAALTTFRACLPAAALDTLGGE